eukprot:scaffold178510_cov20-Tisochrysis_lutea.AAC.2
MDALRPGMPKYLESLQLRTRVAVIPVMLFTAALLHDAAQQSFFTNKTYSALELGCRACFPYALPQGIGKPPLSSAQFTWLERVGVKSRPLGITSKDLTIPPM